MIGALVDNSQVLGELQSYGKFEYIVSFEGL
jgi:hypothetical protein